MPENPLRTKPKLLLIIPADGWFAEYRHKEGSTFVRLACWGMFEDREKESGPAMTFVDGIIPGPEETPTSSAYNFVRHVHINDMTPEEKAQIT